MRRYSVLTGISLVMVLFTSIAYAGHLQVVNKTGQTLRIECGHDGDHGVMQHLETGHNGGMSVSHNGQVTCSALDINDHHNVIATRNFEYHTGSESFYWEVQGHH